jgi:hypothetical protein
MFSDWVSFLAYPNLFGIKGFVVVVVAAILIVALSMTCSIACSHSVVVKKLMHTMQ